MAESNKDTISKPPMITIWMTAFNHGEFIAHAIESVLMQRTTYDFEIVIGEDFSPDDTRQIVKGFQEKYPDLIKLYLPDVNLGMMSMFLESYKLCRGKYIAWLDGDDYWTDENKLQKQVDFLEANPDYVLTFHSIEYHDTIINKIYPSQHPTKSGTDGSFELEDFFKYNLAASLSVVHRNVLGNQLPLWFKKLPFPDLAMHILLLMQGKAKYFKDTMGVYRIHSSGAWSGIPEYNKTAQLAQFYRKIISHLKLQKNEKITQLTLPLFNSTLEMSIECGKFRNAVIYFFYLNYVNPAFRKEEPVLYNKAIRYFKGIIPRKVRIGF